MRHSFDGEQQQLPPVRVPSMPGQNDSSHTAGLLTGDYVLAGGAGLSQRPGDVMLRPGGQVNPARSARSPV